MAAPGVIAVGVTGYYLLAVANILDAALGIGMPTERPLDRRQRFKVIEGGKATPRQMLRRLTVDRIYLAIIASALLLLVGAAGLYVTRTADLLPHAEQSASRDRDKFGFKPKHA